MDTSVYSQYQLSDERTVYYKYEDAESILNCVEQWGDPAYLYCRIYSDKTVSNQRYKSEEALIELFLQIFEPNRQA